MIRKKIRKKQKRINSFHIGVCIFSVGVSFGVVYFCGLFQQRSFSSSYTDTLSYQATRIADAFEQYNDKRFTQP